MAEWKETDSSSLAALTRDTSTLADAAESMQSLVETIWRLRQPDGCPWDREQTHESIAKNMIEEAYQAVDCIEQNDEVHLREELGECAHAGGSARADRGGCWCLHHDGRCARHQSKADCAAIPTCSAMTPAQPRTPTKCSRSGIA